MSEALFTLLLALAVVTVVGHGLWLGIAWILRGGRQQPQSVASRRPDVVLDTLAQQIQRANAAGAIDTQTADRLLRAVADEQSLLAEQAAARSAPAAQRPEQTVMAQVVDEPVEQVPVSSAEPRPAIRQPAPAPAPPRRAWTDYLAAFMEERNIRWGELVGGLLIVCGSIALVISFWSAIAERPLLKFLLFNGVTAGLFGVGFYSEHRWRLRTTSQGLLTIACLLVPLNFLAIAAFTTGTAANNPITIAGEIFSIGLFSALLYFAGRILVPRVAIAVVAGVVVPSIAQLLVRRFAGPDSPPHMLWSLAALPLGCYWLAGGWSLVRAAKTSDFGEASVNALFKFLGLISFAAILPLGLLLARTERPMLTLHELSLAVSLLGLVPLSFGLLVWERLAGGGLPNLRTAGTSIGVFGAMLSLAGLVVGWPDPVTMLPAAVVEFVVFTAVAWRFRLPAAHLVAAACLAASYLFVAYLFDGQIAWRGQDARRLAATLIAGGTGTLLVPLALAYGAAAFLALRRWGRGSHLLDGTGSVLACASAGLATLSVGLVSWFGFAREGDPVGAGWVYLVYAAGAIVVAARNRRSVFAWAGAVLLLAAVVQGVVFRYAAPLDIPHPELTAILVYCTACAAIAALVHVTRLTIDQSRLGGVLCSAAFVLSVVGAAWLVRLMPVASAGFEAGYWLWLAAVWLAVAVATARLPVYMLAQVALLVATIFAVVAVLAPRDWFAEARWPWLDPWALQSIGVTLAGLCLAWVIARIALRRWSDAHPHDRTSARAATILASPWLSVDRCTAGGLVALSLVMGTVAAAPGVRQELSPRASSAAVATRDVGPVADFALTDIPHRHAAGWGSWLLVGGVLLLVATISRQQRSGAWLLALFVTAAALCPLVASRFESQVAVASALRWTSVAWLLIASVPIWGRKFVVQRFSWWGRPWIEHEPRLVRQATALVFLLALLPPLAVMLQIGLSAVLRAPAAGVPPVEWLVLFLIFGTAIVAAGVLRTAPERFFAGDATEPRPTWPRISATLAVVLGAAPIAAVAIYQVGVTLTQTPILGPEPDSIFVGMGLAASYGVPILVTAVVLVGYAARERSSAFALGGGLVFNAAATAAFMLAQAGGGLVFDAALWIRVAQLNAVVAACYALAWLAIIILRKRQPDAPPASEFDFKLGAQVALAPALVGLVLGWAWCDLVANPQALQQVMNPELVDVWGWLSLALAAASGAVAAWAAGRRLSMAGVSAALFALVVMAAAVAGRWDIGNWLAYNTLLTGHAVVAVALLAIAWHERRADAALGSQDGEVPLPNEHTAAWSLGSSSAIWVDLARVIVFVLAIRELPDSRWWPVAALAMLAATGAASAWIFQRRRYLYDAALTLNLSGSIAVLESGYLTGFADFVLANVVLLTVPVVGWLAIEQLSIRHRLSRPRFQLPPMHRVATRIAIATLAIVAGVGLAGDALDQLPPDVAAWMPWVALAATAVAAGACLWDTVGRDSVARLYVLGLVAVAMLLDTFNLQPQWLLWMGNMVVAAYVLVTSYLWSRREGLRLLADRLRIPRGAENEFAGLAWLVPCNLLLVTVIVLMTGLVEWTEHDVSLRVLAAQALLTQVVSVALVARGDRRGVLQTVALALGAAGAVMFGWSWLIPGASGTLLHGLVVVAAALAGVAALYGLGLGKLLRERSDWLAPARRMTPWLAALTAASIAAILGTEIYQFASLGAVAMAWPAILAVGLTLVGLTIASLAAALLPGRDPLNLSPRGRTLYVYGAEVLLALAFIHVRLTMPWLFTGFFEQYWPLVVMAIAFAGVGFSELCHRYRQEVLAEPVQNTGALLPVLPVLGFWFSDTHVDYSLLLLAVGLLYAGLSITRRSFGFGILAAIAANGGLWYFLNRADGLGFLAHPQIWLIPPAMCILVAAHLNRSQLGDAQMTAVRYLTSMMIYVSSTADIFLNGVADHLWLPLVLGGLSIVGILAGIMMRVRAFLLLGISFLGLALFTIIWYAAVDLEQTWIWYASLIVAGGLIIALFAVFEKKRREVLDVFDRIKQWEA